MHYQVILINDEITNKNYYHSYFLSDDTSLGNITVTDLPPYQDINKARSCYWDSENKKWIFDEGEYNKFLQKLSFEKEKEFEDYKYAKILESKQILALYLEQNPIKSTAHNGVEGTYAVTEEKQNLMTSNYLTWQIESQLNPDAVLTWNETGKSCEPWKPEEFLQLILEIKNFVKPRIVIQQTYEEQVLLATSKDDIDLISLSYDV